MQSQSYYALTISPSYRPLYCTTEDLSDIVDRIKCKALLFDVHLTSYERTKNGYLHLHALITMCKNQYLKLITRHPGYSVRIKRINSQWDQFRWEYYLCKDYLDCKTKADCQERQLEIITGAYLQVHRFKGRANKLAKGF